MKSKLSLYIISFCPNQIYGVLSFCNSFFLHKITVQQQWHIWQSFVIGFSACLPGKKSEETDATEGNIVSPSVLLFEHVKYFYLQAGKGIDLINMSYTF